MRYIYCLESFLGLVGHDPHDSAFGGAEFHLSYFLPLFKETEVLFEFLAFPLALATLSILTRVNASHVSHSVSTAAGWFQRML